MCHGEHLPSSFFDALKGEVIEATQLHSKPVGRIPDLDIVLLWLSPRAPVNLVRSFRSWIEEVNLKVGLIGCSPNGDIEDTTAAFEAGVDDFVAGRCCISELASRIHSLSKRLKHPSPRAKTVQGMKLDALSHEVECGDRTIRLTAKEVAVLKVLIDAKGGVLSRSAILDLAWGEHLFEIGERAVDNVILRLRRKLAEPQVIETVRGVGFRLS